jgi:putative transposase
LGDEAFPGQGKSRDDAQQKIEAWRVDYNEYRPHQSLNDKTPTEFVTEHQQAEFF